MLNSKSPLDHWWSETVVTGPMSILHQGQLGVTFGTPAGRSSLAQPRSTSCSSRSLRLERMDSPGWGVFVMARPMGCQQGQIGAW